MVNYWQLWLPTLYRNYTVFVTVFVLEHIAVELKLYTVADNTVFS